MCSYTFTHKLMNMCSAVYVIIKVLRKLLLSGRTFDNNCLIVLQCGVTTNVTISSQQE